MKQLYFTSVILLFSAGLANAQQDKKTPVKLLRIYEDNDFINIRGKGTDEAYTNGTSIDFFYTRNKKSSLFLDKLFLKAGDSSINIYGWSITQLMFTPRDISKTTYQPNDYSYSGALFASRKLYSYNAVKKYSLQSELMIGVRGPGALAEQTQTFIHKLLHFQKPIGWQYQLDNKLIANIRVAVEKQLFSFGKSVEIIGGSEIAAGTFVNSLAVYPKIRIGKMAPYFNGIISQYSTSAKYKNNVQAYIIIQPAIIISASNGLLQSNSKITGNKNEAAKSGDISRTIYLFSSSAVFAINHFSISFTQNITSTMVQHLYSHQVGNISLYFSW